MTQKGPQEVQTPELGKIPGAAPPPPSPPKSSEPKSKSQLIADIRQKLLSKIDLTGIFKIDDTEYKLRIIDRKDMVLLHDKLVETFNFDKKEWFNPKKNFLQQFEAADTDSVLMMSSAVLKKAIVEIDGVSIEELFGEGSPFKSFEEGLEKYINASSTPLIDLLGKYMELIRRDKETVTEVKNSSGN